MSRPLTCNEAIHLLLTAEPDSAEATTARRHTETCPRCASAFDDPWPTARMDRILDVPEPSRRIRVVLGTLSATQIVVAIPWLFERDLLADIEAVAAAHLTRDGALGLAIGTAGLLTAWRPRYAGSGVWMCAVAFLAQALAVGLDMSTGRTVVAFEVVHLPMLVIAALVWISRRRSSAPADRDAVAIERPTLRRVE